MKFYEIFEIYFEILGNLLKFWKSAIGQHSTNSVNGGNNIVLLRDVFHIGLVIGPRSYN